ncbi:MAG: xanthine dehydrogenase family protein subunit M [Thermomicrobiaceae bacterium]|nr:xanthine dehydrogenase family protein subunit M [Thermomicrobiaceae bacterium]
MPEIDWREPDTLAEVLDLLARYGDDARVVAGGTWLTMVLRLGLIAPSLLVSLRRVSGLDGIALDDEGALHLGAMARHRAVERSPLVARFLPALAETYASVANVRVRHQATVGGNLCDADYASDPPAVLAALDASLTAVSARGARRIPARDFIVDHYETALAPDELVTEVVVPAPPPGAGAAYLKFRSRSHEDRPCVGVAALVDLAPDGACRRLEVVVGAVAGRPQRLGDVLAAAVGRPLDDRAIAEVADAYAAGIEPLSDLRGSDWYRRRMIRVFTARAIRAALARRPRSQEQEQEEQIA